MKQKFKQVFTLLLAMIMMFSSLTLVASAESCQPNFRIAKQVYKDADGTGNRTAYTYDQKGNLIKVVNKDSNGRSSRATYTYDQKGRLTKEVRKSSGKDGNITANVTYTYDEKGNLSKEAYKGSDGVTYSITYTYDQKGNLIKEAYKNSNGQSYNITCDYDKNGNLLKEVYKDNIGSKITITYTYDEKGKVIKSIYKDSNGIKITSTYTYDKKGNLIKEVNKNNLGYDPVTTYTYDKKGKLTKKDVKYLGYNYAVSTSTYKYDQQGNLLKEVCKTNEGQGTTQTTSSYSYRPFELNEEQICDNVFVRLEKTSYAYDGKVKKPAVIVRDSNGMALKSGVDYTVTYASGRKDIGTYNVKVKLKGHYSGSKKLTFKIVPAKVTRLKAPAQTAKSITLSWGKVSGAAGYEVYKYDSSKKAYVKVKATKDTTYKVTDLKAGTAYKFKVRAYKKVNDSTVYGVYSSVLSTATNTEAPKVTVAAGSKKATLSWNKVKGATGYVVYMATGKDDTYKEVGTIKKAETVNYTQKDLKKGKTYYFKVRASKTIDGKKVYSEYSNVAKVKVQ